MTREEALRLVRNIQFESIDKDNMEFMAHVSCYQRDAIDELMRLVDPPDTLSKAIARDIHEGRFPSKLA